eukprot:3455185-Karenia_brevis.AAC.1
MCESQWKDSLRSRSERHDRRLSRAISHFAPPLGEWRGRHILLLSTRRSNQYRPQFSWMCAA